LDCQRCAEQVAPVAHDLQAQARSLAGRFNHARPIIRDSQGETATAPGKTNVDLAGPGMLDRVVQGLLRYPVEVGGVSRRDMRQILTLEITGYP
jgi:hypothetical protein